MTSLSLEEAEDVELYEKDSEEENPDDPDRDPDFDDTGDGCIVIADSLLI